MSHLVVDQEGRRVRLAVARTARGVWIGWRGGAHHFAPEESPAGAREEETREVRAPMTGCIVKVEVAAGDRVAEDDLVVILEAMKMEYRLTAPRTGTVEAVHCREGDLVDLGATLVSLEAMPVPEAAAGPGPAAEPGAAGPRDGAP